jgi:hypothetical protein
MFDFLYNFLMDRIGRDMTYEIKNFLRNSPRIGHTIRSHNVNTEDENSILGKRVRHRKYTI